MEKLKEYAGVIIAMVTVMSALAALGLWAIDGRINPEIRRLDGRIESQYAEITGRLDRMDSRLDRMDSRLDRMNDRVEAQFNRIDVKTILSRLPKPQEAG